MSDLETLTVTIEKDELKRLKAFARYYNTTLEKLVVDDYLFYGMLEEGIGASKWVEKNLDTDCVPIGTPIDKP